MVLCVSVGREREWGRVKGEIDERIVSISEKRILFWILWIFEVWRDFFYLILIYFHKVLILSPFIYYNIWIFEFKKINSLVSFVSNDRKIYNMKTGNNSGFNANTWRFLKCFKHLPTNGRTVLKKMLKWWYSHLLGGIYQYIFQFQSPL